MDFSRSRRHENKLNHAENRSTNTSTPTDGRNSKLLSQVAIAGNGGGGKSRVKEGRGLPTWTSWSIIYLGSSSPRLRLAPLTMTKTTRTVTLIAAGWRLAFSTEFDQLVSPGNRGRTPPLKFTGRFPRPPPLSRGMVFAATGEALMEGVTIRSTWSLAVI